MNTLSVDLGVQEYVVNDACTITFNPTDASFIGRLYDAFERLAAHQDAYEKKLKEAPDAAVLLDFMIEQDRDMRQIIDGVFNSPVCDGVMGSMNVFALGNTGLPVWSNFLLAVLDCCEADAKRKAAQTSKTMDKYLKKYHR